MANRTAPAPRLIEQVRARRQAGDRRFTLPIADVADPAVRLDDRDRAADDPPRGALARRHPVGGPDPFAVVRIAVREGQFDES